MPCPSCNSCPMPNRFGSPNFDPLEAVEGDPNSPIWIVSLNPKTEEDDHARGEPNPINWADTDPAAPHFIRLKGILGTQWYGRLFQQDGIAHTDIVKCGSPSFTSIEVSAIQYCVRFFFAQVKVHKPRLLLVLSSEAARIIAEEARLGEANTEGWWQFGTTKEESCYVVLSGYSAPRQERYARLRLKRDFLAAAAQHVGQPGTPPTGLRGA